MDYFLKYFKRKTRKNSSNLSKPHLLIFYSKKLGFKHIDAFLDRSITKLIKLIYFFLRGIEQRNLLF
ncbi:hypothetical protein DB42_BQ00050 [Neochlamydia sp. EPS4]|nr:hypothetical protein DB42_BQ00050 [Neochlamydia sp. EPS4]